MTWTGTPMTSWEALSCTTSLHGAVCCPSPFSCCMRGTPSGLHLSAACMMSTICCPEWYLSCLRSPSFAHMQSPTMCCSHIREAWAWLRTCLEGRICHIVRYNVYMPVLKLRTRAGAPAAAQIMCAWTWQKCMSMQQVWGTTAQFAPSCCASLQISRGMDISQGGRLDSCRAMEAETPQAVFMYSIY